MNLFILWVRLCVRQSSSSRSHISHSGFDDQIFFYIEERQMKFIHAEKKNKIRNIIYRNSRSGIILLIPPHNVQSISIPKFVFNVLYM